MREPLAFYRQLNVAYVEETGADAQWNEIERHISPLPFGKQGIRTTLPCVWITGLDRADRQTRQLVSIRRQGR